jgi:hypothetical protein
MVALGGLVLALVYRTLADRVFAAFVLAYFLTLMPLDAHFDRYVLPLVPALGALAGRFRALAPVTLLLLVIPLVWSIRETRPLVRTDTRVVAHDWMDRNLTPGVLVAADPATAAPADVRALRLALPSPGRPALSPTGCSGSANAIRSRVASTTSSPGWVTGASNGVVSADWRGLG